MVTEGAKSRGGDFRASAGLFFRLKGTGNGSAVSYMMLTVAGFSMIPLVVAWGGGAENPLLFNSGWRLGVVIGCLFFLPICNGSLLRNRIAWQLIWQRTFSWAMLFVIIGSFQFALFTYSTRFIDIAIAAVLLETWPIFLIILTGQLFKSEHRFRATSVTTFILVALGFGGFILVIASQTADPRELLRLESASVFALGIFLAMVAAGVSVMEAAFNFRWGVSLSRELFVAARLEKEGSSLELFCVIIAFTIASIVSTPIHAAAGLLSGESITGESLAIAIVGGGIVQAVASILYRAAILNTNNLGINALGYTVPIFSLLWLAIFSHIRVARPDYLVIGAAAIITANVLIYFEPKIQQAGRDRLRAVKWRRAGRSE